MAELPRAFGPYVLLKPLGASGTSEVFLARPLDPNGGVPTPVVIKRLHGELAAQDEFFGRFTHEAQIAVAVESPHLPKVYDVGRVGDSVYIAMEYLTGWTIARLISDLQAAGQQASLSSVADVIAGALAALHVLHSATDRETGAPLDIVHRDIAPKNVMVGEDGLTRLIDFGLGKSRLKEWKTETGLVLGTPGYMAPEQIVGRAVDHRTDIYAMGIVLFELLTLRTFIRRGPVPLMLRAAASPQFVEPSSIRKDVPPALDEVLRLALAVDPADRFQSARDFHDALRSSVPKGDQLDPLPTLVGEMLWGELDEERSQVTELVSGSTPLVELVESPPAEHLNATELSPVPGLAPQAEPPHDLTSNDRPTPLPRGRRRTEPQVMGVPAALPEKSGVPPKLVIALMLATLGVGVISGVLIMGRPKKSPVTAEEITAPLAAPLPSASAKPAEVREEEPEPETVREIRRERVTTVTTPAPVTAPAKKRTAEPATPSHAREETAAAQSPRERAGTLIKRARSVKQKLQPGSADAQLADNVINRLLMEASSNDDEGAMQRLAVLESELRKLEAGAH